MHATGRGTPLDYAKANSLYEAAAAAGEARGFFGVGLLYLDGQGVPRDGETAAAWFSVATALGDPSAKAMTDRLLAGQKTDVLDRIAEKANAIYAQYVAPLTAAAPAAPPARPARTP
ncbi:sel1 repeat family protein [Sphingopyxis sp. YF1]|nr:sel1 repeat family protein [Sphingopyxis sp. YF1]